MDSDAILIRQNYIEDGLGQSVVDSETLLPIPVRVDSVSRAEFFSAGKIGITPDYVLITAACNYNGENLLIFNAERYAIYRTFRNGDSDEIELYIKKETGLEL